MQNETSSFEAFRSPNKPGPQYTAYNNPRSSRCVCSIALSLQVPMVDLLDSAQGRERRSKWTQHQQFSAAASGR